MYLFLFVVVVSSPCYQIVCFVEGRKPNETSVDVAHVSCDRLPDLPKNESFCVCRMNDTQALVDLRGLAYGQSDPKRKNPRFVAKDEYGWSVGWSPCSDFSMYDNPLQPWKGCFDVAIGRFTNETKYCEPEGYHESSYFKVISADPSSRIRVQIDFRDPLKQGRPVMNVIQLVCDQKMTKPQFRFSHRNEYGTNIFKLRSSSCCERGKHSEPTTSGDPPDPPNVKMIAGISAGVVGALLLFIAVAFGICRCRRNGYDPMKNEPHPQPEEHSA